ncbi:MAG TPA: LuxR C-terminal-related transcriptional regulator [Demequina sp.]|nr:LuxR C-terminal-related transcriptional regulator [Demequina sp.]
MEDAVYWQAMALDAATSRAMDAQGGERVALITTALAQATSLYKDGIDEQPEMCRELLVSACRAQATLTRLGEAPDPRLEARLHEIQKIVESDAVGEPYALVGDAFVRETASETGALDAWRAAMSLIETEPVQVAVPRRLEHEARYRLAVALADAGEKAEAVALLRRVVHEAPPHGIALVARWAREALKRLGADSTPTSGPLEGLTPRELEVLALVAEGLTNREIGARLFMSPKTASVHVSAILAKLGASNRTEAATLYTTRLARDPD